VHAPAKFHVRRLPDRGGVQIVNWNQHTFRLFLEFQRLLDVDNCAEKRSKQVWTDLALSERRDEDAVGATREQPGEVALRSAYRRRADPIS